MNKKTSVLVAAMAGLLTVGILAIALPAPVQAQVHSFNGNGGIGGAGGPGGFGGFGGIGGSGGIALSGGSANGGDANGGSANGGDGGSANGGCNSAFNTASGFLSSSNTC